MGEKYIHDFQKDIISIPEKDRELMKKIDNKMKGVSPDEYDTFVLSRRRNIMAEVSSKKLESFLDKEKKYVGLELGVGTGIYTEALNRIPNLKLKGIEIREDMINFGFAKSRFEKNQIVMGDFHQLPFADGSFDLVTGLAIAKQREDVMKFYSEIKRVLKEGGLFFIPFIRPKNETIERESQVILDHGLDILEKSGWYILAKKSKN